MPTSAFAARTIAPTCGAIAAAVPVVLTANERMPESGVVASRAGHLDLLQKSDELPVADEDSGAGWRSAASLRMSSTTPATESADRRVGHVPVEQPADGRAIPKNRRATHGEITVGRAPSRGTSAGRSRPSTIATPNAVRKP